MRRALTLVVLLGSLAAAWIGLPSRGIGPDIAGVVIVTLDTTRADRLSPYGFMDVKMPALERLARDGVLFTQAMTSAPLTLPAHASLLTGLLPQSHGVRDNVDRPLAGARTTLAEVLSSNGFRTGAFVGSVVLQSDRGLAQGFGTYGEIPTENGRPVALQRRGSDVVDEAIEWLAARHDAPFFAWVHLYDAHAPYDPPAEFRSRHDDPYVGELLYADAQVERILDALDRWRLADRTVVVVAGDHGEGLGEHDEATHGERLYDSVLRVPLIVRAPSVQPRRVLDVVRLIDVAPTVLDLLGMRGPAMDGTSLMPALRGERVDVEAYAEALSPARRGLAPIRALRDGRFKLIVGDKTELYDLDLDAFEQHNVAAERARMADTMRGRLMTLAGPPPEDGAPLFRDEVSPEVRERLAALGYLAGPAPQKRQP